MTAPAPAPPTGEAFHRLKRRVIERTGHFYYEDKDDLLWERVRRRLAQTRQPSLERYLDRLEDPELGPSEWTALVAELTIGETYFFRYPEQFEALRETILPAIFRRAAESRRLRIWSAGCANGAEPYSLAILMHELLGEQLADWRVSIVGTDINETFLAAAREARFGRWALRSVTPAQRDAWFAADGPDRWLLKPQYRGLVRFQRANLLDLLDPAPPLDFVDFDLILCRNVLIYFHPEKVLELAAALVERLRPDGWLLVGHAEPSPAFSRVAQAVTLQSAVAYRPAEAPSAPPPPAAPPPPPLAAELILPAVAFASTRARALPPPAPRPAEGPALAGPGPDLAAEARRRADVGDYAGAELSCREGLARQPQDPVLHFYAGLVAQALGRLAQAEDALRRATYLDPTFVMALYHLGLVRLSRGRRQAGRKSIAAAAQLAGTLTVDVHLPEGAGLTAGDMRELARLRLETDARGA